MPLWWIEYVACTYLTGLILVIHFVHYPSFRQISESAFKEFSVQHAKSITPIVFPAMAIELGVAGLLLYSEADWRSALNLALVMAIWAITGLKSARTHSEFAKSGFQTERYEDLMRWNRVRTALWVIRFMALSIFLWRA